MCRHLTQVSLGEPDYISLSKMIASALLDTYPVETNEAVDLELRVANAFRDAIYFYEITNPVAVTMNKPAKDIKLNQFHELGVDGVALLFPESLPHGVDWLNIHRSEWRHPVSGETSILSVPDLFAHAVTDAMIEMKRTLRVFAGKKSPEDFISFEGNSCLSVCGKDGKIGTVLYANPFDFAPVLLDQAEKRRLWISTALS